MKDVFNDNKEPISDCESESENRPYKPGHYYNGNETEKAGYKLGGQGSMGLDYDQGAKRCSEIPTIEEFAISADSSMKTITEGKQGSAAHLKI